MKDTVKQEKIISQLKSLVKSNKGIVSLNEAIANLGHSQDEVMSAFNRMLELFESKASLNPDTGGLQFAFKYPLWQRGKKTASEKLAVAAGFLLKVFKQIYKASVGIVMVAYTIFFVIVLLAISLAGSGNNSDNDRGNGFEFIYVMLRAVMEAFMWRSITRPFVYEYDRHGNKFKSYQQPQKGAGFIKSAFAFVFGPEIPQYDPLADAREVVAYVRLKTQGKLTAANIIELSGANYEKADSKLAEYSGKFNGNLNITNEGLLYGDFVNLLENKSAKEAQFIEYYQDEVEPPIKFMGNSAGMNFGIVLMNGFNLIMSWLMISAFNGGDFSFITNSAGEVIEIPFVQYFFVAYFPLVVSALFFIIPLLRIPSYLSRKNNRNKRVLHKILIGYICQQRKKEFSAPEFYSLVNNKLDNVNDSEVLSMLNQITTELQGTIEIKENGQAVYTFERLYDELTIK